MYLEDIRNAILTKILSEFFMNCNNCEENN